MSPLSSFSTFFIESLSWYYEERCPPLPTTAGAGSTTAGMTTEVLSMLPVFSMLSDNVCGLTPKFFSYTFTVLSTSSDLSSGFSQIE